ncbi:MAG: hypothetical protein PHF12_05240 [Candidatus Omnitrophica bacterium]|nr:hypothetical protein [Candidatus Omnitrophota bacterium]
MKKLLLIAALIVALFVPYPGWAAELNNITSAGVDGNLVFYDKSGNAIMTLDAANRKLSFPSGSLLETLGTTITLRNVSYTLPANNGDASQYLQTDGSGVLSWAAGSASTTAWDDIGDPDADGTVAFGNTKQTISSTLNAAGAVVTITNTTADLGADVSFIDLKYTDDGDSNGYFIRAYDNAGAALKFSVGPDGAVTIAGTAEGTDALTITGGDITLTDGDLTLSSGDLSVTGNFTLTGSFYQSAVAAAAAGNVNLTVDAAGNGTITIGGTSTGNTIFPGVAVFNGNVDIGNAATDTLSITSIIDSSVTLDDGATDSPSFILKDATDETATFVKKDGANLQLTTTATEGLQIITGNLWVGNGSPGTAAMDGEDFYVNGDSEFDGSVQLDGAVTFAGTVAVNGAPTITNVEASYTTNADDQFAFARNQGTTTKPLVAITTSAAADDAAALAVTSGATGAVDAATISNAGTAAGLHVTSTAAGGVGIDIDVANSATGRVFYADLGPWLGTADQGALELVSDSAATIAAGQLLRLNQQGSGQHAAAIDGSVVYVADAATAPGAGTSYAVKIAPTNIASLHATTAAQFDTTVTATGLITANGGMAINEDVAVTFDAHDEEIVVDASDTDYAAASAVMQIKGSAGAGQTNSSYLLALDRNAHGDGQDNFIIMRDNAYADTQFKVDSGGATTIAGLLTASGGATVTGATNLTAAVLSGASPLLLDGNTADGTNRLTIALADPTAARTLTLPDATGTANLNCTATHDYAGAAADWTLSVAEMQCGFITVTNANGAVNAYVPTAIPGKTYTVNNGSGQVLTFKVTGQTGGTIANGKWAFYTTLAADVVEVYELP